MATIESCPSTRWAWVEVDLGALRRNTRAFKDLMEPGVQMMAVVKADAYGHGAVECSRAMLSAGADQLAVATVNEGVELREAGITAPVLVLSEPPVDSVETLVEHDVMPCVDTRAFALALGECAAAHDKVARYHLSLETGMCRVGVPAEDAVEFRRSIDFHRALECAGTLTHFATADTANSWGFEAQLRRFEDAVAAMRGAGIECGLVHCDNTPATVLYPSSHFDMCRVGVGLYGLQPCEATRPRLPLEPVMSVRARVTRVMCPPIGTQVSYGGHYTVTSTETQVATIPVGYADGLSRCLSGRMDVLVRGHRLPQVGSICMDQCMFAAVQSDRRVAEGVGEVRYGDLVTVMGADGDDAITADELAEIGGTINYEVVCDFGMRLEKVYV